MDSGGCVNQDDVRKKRSSRRKEDQGQHEIKTLEKVQQGVKFIGIKQICGIAGNR